MKDEQARAAIIAAWIVGILGCVGVIIAAFIAGGLPLIERWLHTPEPKPTITIMVTSTSTQVPPTMAPTRPTATPVPPVTVNPTAADQLTQCQWLQKNFPQTSEEAKTRFRLPSDTTINFIYELCPSTANAFGFKAKTDVELQVLAGGCIDSWAGFTKYVGDVGTPVPDGWGGWRVYKGTVRAPEMTYRIMGCK